MPLVIHVRLIMYRDATAHTKGISMMLTTVIILSARSRYLSEYQKANLINVTR